MPTIEVTLYPEERKALVELARAEKRDPRAQAAMVIRDHLIKAGRLPKVETSKDANGTTA